METKAKSEEKIYRTKVKNFMGYSYPVDTLTISMIGIFAALICVLTMIIVIPIPATQGFINIGDAGVMIAGLLFGPIIGGIAGGVGSALADIILGFYIYALATLIIKGLEGFIVGLIANPKKNYKKLNYRDILAVVIGGAVMVFGYLIYETIIYGFQVALYEVIPNGIQFGVSVILAITFTKTVRKNIIESIPQVFDKIFVIEVNGESIESLRKKSLSIEDSREIFMESRKEDGELEK